MAMTTKKIEIGKTPVQLPANATSFQAHSGFGVYYAFGDGYETFNYALPKEVIFFDPDQVVFLKANHDITVSFNVEG